MRRRSSRVAQLKTDRAGYLYEPLFFAQPQRKPRGENQRLARKPASFPSSQRVCTTPYARTLEHDSEAEMAHARLSALLLSAAGLLHLARRASAFSPPSTGHSLVPHLRAARCPAPLANEYDDWWDERRAKHAAVDNQAWAAAKAREAAYDTGSAAGRAALRAARAKAASASAASAVPGTLLQLDEDFRWSGEMMSDEFSCWSPPPSSSVGLVLHEFVRSDYARVVFK